MVTKLSDGPDLFDLKLTKHLFDGIPKYVINLWTLKFVPGAKIDRFLRCSGAFGDCLSRSDTQKVIPKELFLRDF